MTNAFFNPLDYQAIKPEILVAIFGLAILLFDFLLDKRLGENRLQVGR